MLQTEAIHPSLKLENPTPHATVGLVYFKDQTDASFINGVFN